MSTAPEPPRTGVDRGDAVRLGGLIVALLVVVAVVLLAGGGGGGSTSSSGQVRGVLLTVSDQQLVLRNQGGETETFEIRPQDRGRLDLFHLRQHAADQLPSIVYYDQVGDTSFAVRVVDA